MSTLHPLSHGTPLSEFDIFSVPPTQLSVKYDIETEHRPLQPITPDRLVQFEFTTAPNEYVKWCDTELFLTARVVIYPVGNKLEADSWEHFELEDNLMHTMIQSVDLSINGRLVTKASVNYAYRAYFDNYLGYDKSAKEGHLSSVVYQDISRSRYVPSDLTSVVGPYFEMRGKLCIDIAQQGRAMLGGLKFKLEIRFNKPVYGFNRKGTKLPFEVQLEVGNTSLFVHRAIVSEGTLVAHTKALQHATAKYPITRHEVQGVTIPGGIMDIMLDRIFNGQLPRRALVGFVRSTAFNGDYSRSPFIFEHFELDHLTFTIDGISFPRTPYQPNFEKKLYMREYYAFLQTYNQDGPSSCLDLTYEEYMEQEKILLAYNFAPDLGDGYGFGGHLSLIKQGAFGLHVRFAQPLKEPIVAIVFAEFDNLIQINKDLQVFTDYVV